MMESGQQKVTVAIAGHTWLRYQKRATIRATKSYVAGIQYVGAPCVDRKFKVSRMSENKLTAAQFAPAVAAKIASALTSWGYVPTIEAA